jgi:hypothetical protein
MDPVLVSPGLHCSSIGGSRLDSYLVIAVPAGEALGELHAPSEVR